MPRILIADDNPQNAELMEAHLDGTDCETRIAADGEETIALAKTWKPDLVLLDIMMPKLSGFDVCKRLKAAPETRGIGVLIVTALDEVSDIERAVDVGTDDFLTKPIHKSELLLRVRALLDSRAESNDVDRGLAYFRRVLQGH